MSLIKGRDLKGIELWRTCYSHLKHRSHTWKRNQVNIDPLPFNPSGIGEGGGLYFSTLNYVMMSCVYQYEPVSIQWIGRIRLDDDEDVWQEDGQWKAHQVEWYDVKQIKDLTAQDIVNMAKSLQGETETLEQCWIALLRLNGRFLEVVTEQTHDMCMAAVKNDGAALQFVHEQTPDICAAAISCFMHALTYVHDQTYELCSLPIRAYVNYWRAVIQQGPFGMYISLGIPECEVIGAINEVRDPEMRLRLQTELALAQKTYNI